MTAIQNEEFRADTKEKMSKEITSEITVQKIRQNADLLKSNFIKKVDSQLDEMIEDFVQDVALIEKQNSDFINGKNVSARQSERKPGEMHDKVFVNRRSLLTDLFEVSHISTIHNIFVAILLLFFLNGFLCDLLDKGAIQWDLDIVWYAFGKMNTVVFVWVLMKLSTVVILYPGFEYWAWKRILSSKFMDPIFLFLYILYLTFMSIYPLYVIVSENLPPASSNIVLCEQIRLIMKVHAFVRENIPRALKYKPHQDGDKSNDDGPCPDFSKFLYFLFVPTLVYRDNYPRTKKVRWRYVALNFLQVFGCVIYIIFIFQRFCIPVFKKFGQEPFTPKTLFLAMFSCMLPGFLVFLSTFYALLHCWMNAFAEMLTFGDRLFYMDWWNSRSFSTYYRTWNLVVHDWLYSYVYKDVCKITSARRRLVPMFMVFLLSAVVHEYIVTFTLGFFFPILFVLFQGFGVWFVFITSKAKSSMWNVFLWMSLIAGTGLLLALYSMEWYSHKNCPPNGGILWEMFVPRFFHCDRVLHYSS